MPPTLQNTNAVIGKLTRIGAPDRVSKPRPRRLDGLAERHARIVGGRINRVAALPGV
jgi:hypothetical protein